MHSREIDRLDHEIATEHLALIPLALYFKEGRVKVEIGRGSGPQEGRQAPGHGRARFEAGDGEGHGPAARKGMEH